MNKYFVLFFAIVTVCLAFDNPGENHHKIPLGSCMSPLDCPSVYDLTVAEETNCDGQNIVTVCYSMLDIDGDDINAVFAIEHAGTTITPITVTDDVPGFPGPNLGLLPSGTYCFNWNLGVDFPDIEDCDFDFRIEIDNETTDILNVVDTISIHDAEGIAWDGSDLWITRSTSVAGADTQYIWLVDPVTHDSTLICDLTG